MDCVLVFITAPDMETARSIARVLVEERLAAGVNLVPGVRSIYRWKGEIHDEPEVQLLLQTRADRVADLAARVAALHPYEVPEVMALPIAAGHVPYLDWIRSEVNGPSGG